MPLRHDDLALKPLVAGMCPEPDPNSALDPIDLVRPERRRTQIYYRVPTDLASVAHCLTATKTKSNARVPPTSRRWLAA